MYQIKKDGITKSLLSIFMQCENKFRIITSGLAFKPKLSMLIGTYGHKSIEQHRLTGKIILPKVKEGKYVQTVVHGILKILIPAYFDFWGDAESKADHKVEFLFDEIKSGMRLRGKIDDVYNHDTVLDTKFKSRIADDSIADLLPLSIDGLFYCYAMGLNKFMIDVVRFPTVKEGKLSDFDKLANEVKNNPQEYFLRKTVEYSIKDIELFETELDEYCDRIEFMEFAKRNLSACWNCEFVKYCTTGDKTGLTNKKLFSELEE
jgi:hypothetical protein